MWKNGYARSESRFSSSVHHNDWIPIRGSAFVFSSHLMLISVSVAFVVIGISWCLLWSLEESDYVSCIKIWFVNTVQVTCYLYLSLRLYWCSGIFNLHGCSCVHNLRLLSFAGASVDLILQRKWAIKVWNLKCRCTISVLDSMSGPSNVMKNFATFFRSSSQFRTQTKRE